MENENQLWELWRKHKWAIILAVAGFFFALLAIKYSFMKAVFIYICIALGIWGGHLLDSKTNIRNKVKDLFRND